MRPSWKQQLMFVCPIHVTQCLISVGQRSYGIQSFHAAIYNHMQTGSSHCGCQ